MGEYRPELDIDLNMTVDLSGDLNPEQKKMLVGNSGYEFLSKTPLHPSFKGKSLDIYNFSYLDATRKVYATIKLKMYGSSATAKVSREKVAEKLLDRCKLAYSVDHTAFNCAIIPAPGDGLGDDNAEAAVEVVKRGEQRPPSVSVALTQENKTGRNPSNSGPNTSEALAAENGGQNSDVTGIASSQPLESSINGESSFPSAAFTPGVLGRSNSEKRKRTESPMPSKGLSRKDREKLRWKIRQRKNRIESHESKRVRKNKNNDTEGMIDIAAISNADAAISDLPVAGHGLSSSSHSVMGHGPANGRPDALSLEVEMSRPVEARFRVGDMRDESKDLEIHFFFICGTYKTC